MMFCCCRKTSKRNQSKSSETRCCRCCGCRCCCRFRCNFCSKPKNSSEDIERKSTRDRKLHDRIDCFSLKPICFFLERWHSRMAIIFAYLSIILITFILLIISGYFQKIKT
ncbi:Extracellular domains-containing protein [Sarcoptes scabiei]|nr:Extracellular domains-containing protein [Sarcoptes scabiei]